jgi:hypothetical protein
MAFAPVCVKNRRILAIASPRKPVGKPAAPRRPAKSKSSKSKSSKSKSSKKSSRRPVAPSVKGAKPSTKRWSQRVTQESDALDLKHGVFTLRDPKRIAASLKRSAERSSRRKTSAYRSALSMLTFYINRAGRNLPKAQRERLGRAKTELKRQFGKDA